MSVTVTVIVTVVSFEVAIKKYSVRDWTRDRDLRSDSLKVHYYKILHGYIKKQTPKFIPQIIYLSFSLKRSIDTLLGRDMVPY